MKNGGTETIFIFLRVSNESQKELHRMTTNEARHVLLSSALRLLLAGILKLNTEL